MDVICLRDYVRVSVVYCHNNEGLGVPMRRTLVTKVLASDLQGVWTSFALLQTSPLLNTTPQNIQQFIVYRISLVPPLTSVTDIYNELQEEVVRGSTAGLRADPTDASSVCTLQRETVYRLHVSTWQDFAYIRVQRRWPLWTDGLQTTQGWHCVY